MDTYNYSIEYVLKYYSIKYEISNTYKNYKYYIIPNVGKQLTYDSHIFLIDYFSNDYFRMKYSNFKKILLYLVTRYYKEVLP